VVEKISADSLIFLNSSQFKIHQTCLTPAVQVVDVRCFGATSPTSVPKFCVPDKSTPQTDCDSLIDVPTRGRGRHGIAGERACIKRYSIGSSNAQRSKAV